MISVAGSTAVCSSLLSSSPEAIRAGSITSVLKGVDGGGGGGGGAIPVQIIPSPAKAALVSTKVKINVADRYRRFFMVSPKELLTLYGNAGVTCVKAGRKIFKCIIGKGADPCKLIGKVPER